MSRNLIRLLMVVLLTPLFISYSSAAEAEDDQHHARVTSGSSQEYLPEGVPVLDVRWDPSQDFATFATRTFENYH